MYFLRLLGGISVESDGGPVPGDLGQPRLQALLALLAVAGERGVSRDKLIGYLWPERDKERARHSLANAVFPIRKALGDEALLANGDVLALNAEVVKSDVGSFLEALDTGELETAVDLYEGSFLDGFYGGDGPGFERWVESERQRLADRYADALESLAEASEAAGEYRRAVAWRKRLVGHDPYNSRYALELMQAMVAAGDPGNAIQHAQEHQQRLRDELAAEPDPRVTLLTERLRNEPHRAGGELVVVATSGPAETLAAEATGPLMRKRRSLTWRNVGLGIVVTLAAWGAVAVIGWLFAPRDGDSSLVPERIVVLPFDNRTGDPAHDEFGRYVAEWIADGLVQAGLFQIVPMRTVTRRLAETPSSDHVRDLAEFTEAGTFVTGSFYQRGDSIEFHAEILDARPRAPALLYVIQPAGAPANEAMEAIQQVMQRAAGALAQHFDWEWPEHLSPPPSLEAYRERMKGQALVWRQEFEQANVHFYRALELDSTYLKPILELASSHSNLGDNHTADSLLRILEDQRARLTPFEQARVDRLRADFDGDREADYRAAKELFRLNPHPDLLYTVGWSAHLTNRQSEAAEMFSQRVKSADPGTWSWPFLLNALHELGRHEQELEVAREAQVALPDDPHFLEREAWALAALGRLDEFEDVVDEIARRPAERRSRPFWLGMISIYPGYAMADAAIELQAHGHHGAADELFERTLTFLESPLVKDQAGDPPAVWYRRELAFVLYHAGRWAEAAQLYEGLVAEWPDTVFLSGMLGVTYARLGERQKAREYHDRLGAFQGRHSPGRPTAWQVRIAAALGERERAVNLLQQAFEEGENYGYLRLHKASELWPLRDYPPFQALMKPKG